MNNINLVNKFPYYVQPNSNEKYVFKGGGNVSASNNKVFLPAVKSQLYDIHLVNYTTHDLAIYIETVSTPIGTVLNNSYILFTPTNLGDPTYTITGQGPSSISPVNEKMVIMDCISHANTVQGTEKFITWTYMPIVYDYGIGFARKQTVNNPNTAFEFPDDSELSKVVFDLNMTIELGYGSLILTWYDKITDTLLGAIRVYKQQSPAETITTENAISAASYSVLRNLGSQNIHFRLSTTGVGCLFRISFRKANNIIPPV